MASDLIRRAEAYLCSPEAMTAADDLISDLLAALKAQQPAPAGQTAPQVTQGDNGGRGFTVTQIHGKEVTLAGGGGGATYLVEVQGGVSGKVHIPAPVDAEGLPPLPEPVAWFRAPYGTLEPNPLFRVTGPQALEWSVRCFTEHQLRRAQREAMAVERERCAKLADEYATWGGSSFYEWFKKLAAAIRQGAKT